MFFFVGTGTKLLDSTFEEKPLSLSAKVKVSREFN
jgi:hypothetical protein